MFPHQVPLELKLKVLLTLKLLVTILLYSLLYKCNAKSSRNQLASMCAEQGWKLSPLFMSQLHLVQPLNPHNSKGVSQTGQNISSLHPKWCLRTTIPSRYFCSTPYRQLFTRKSNHSLIKHSQKVRRINRGDIGYSYNCDESFVYKHCLLGHIKKTHRPGGSLPTTAILA